MAPAMSATAPAMPATVRSASRSQKSVVKPDSAMLAAATRMDVRKAAATPQLRAIGGDERTRQIAE